MTICIAGIVENNKVIAITDKMITLGGGVATRYEISDNNKAIKLTDKTVALFAGNVLEANQIFAIAKAKIASMTGAVTVQEVAEKMRESYLEHWMRVQNEQLFQRFGLTLQIFMQQQQNLNSELVKAGNNILGTANIGVEILVAGVDTQPHIFNISNPGTLTNLDTIGYGLIGSGSQHAQLSIIENEFNSGMTKENGLFSLLEAKKRAEYDPGVGQLCDIVIIDTTFTKVDPVKVKKITSTFDSTVRALKKSKVTAAQKIFRLI